MAAEKLLVMEAGEKRKECSIPESVLQFLADCRSRKLSPETVKKYEQVLHPFQKFCEGRGVSKVRGIDLALLRQYVQTLRDSGITLSKKIERLRTYGRFCEEMGWTEKVPATKLKKPQTGDQAVVPFTQEEWRKIVDAIDQYPERNSFGYDNRKRLRAFIYVLRFAALRISDVVKLLPTRVTDGRILVRTQKTGAPVHLVLPPFVIASLRAVANGQNYYFWSGSGKLKSAVGDWQRSVRRLFKLAQIKGHPHMFRHTLAVELLEKGVFVEQVAAILGNSPAIIYKHYAPWVRSRQKALDSAIMQVWESHSAE
jgi:site-specific recombinase XerD